MTQKHYTQWGTFHIVTNAKDRTEWCTWPGVPEMLIRDLRIAAKLYEAEIYAYCVLPDHFHFICVPGPKGLSRFIQSFKCNSAFNIHRTLISRSGEHVLAVTDTMIEKSPTNMETTIKGNVTVTAPRSRQQSLILQTMRFWQKGFFDERIRDERQLTKAFNYVTCNAMLHKLVKDPLDWPWTSLRGKTCI